MSGISRYGVPRSPLNAPASTKLAEVEGLLKVVLEELIECDALQSQHAINAAHALGAAQHVLREALEGVSALEKRRS